MSDTDRVIKHLEFIQSVITRLAHNSFLLKGWSLTVVVAGMVFLARTPQAPLEFHLALVPFVLVFWGLDGYFLWQERLFRKVYDHARVQRETDFAMNPMQHEASPLRGWLRAVFSCTLVPLYLSECAFVGMVFSIAKCL